MVSEILVGAVGQIIGDLVAEKLRQPINRLLDEHELRRNLVVAIERAVKRFSREYRAFDEEIVVVLTEQTQFADLPSVQLALQELLKHPFENPDRSISVLRCSFSDVLPRETNRARIDKAVSNFLEHLGREVLAIPQLQDLYSLYFQKIAAESSIATASHTSALVSQLDDLNQSVKLLAKTSSSVLDNSSDERKVLSSPGPWHNLPQRNYTTFIGRQNELRELRRLMLPQTRHFLVTLDGIGGVGKSTLALEFAYGYLQNYSLLHEGERFEAIVWVSAKRTVLTANGIQHRQQTFSTLSDLYYAIAVVLQQPSVHQVDALQQRSLVEQILSKRRTLLIVDNLETVDDENLLAFLRELPTPTKSIITTRHRIDVAYTIRLTGMPEPDALNLINTEASSRKVDLSSYDCESLLKRTGGIPLAVIWSISLMSAGYGVDSVLRRLGSGQSNIAQFCFDESVSLIREHDSYNLLLSLALFDTSVNRFMLGQVSNLEQDEIGRDDGLAELLQLSLVNKDGDRFYLLPLTRSFALGKLSQQPEMEKRLREKWVSVLMEIAKPYADLVWRRPEGSILRLEGAHLITLAAWAQEFDRMDIYMSILPALRQYYDFTGQWKNRVEILIIGLEYAQLTGDNSRAMSIRNSLAWTYAQQGYYELAEQQINEALKIARSLNEPAWECEALLRYSEVLRRQERLVDALSQCQSALNLVPLLPEAQQLYVRANINYDLGKTSRDLGRFEEAKAHFLAAQDVFRSDVENPVFNLELAWEIIGHLASVELSLGNLEVAEPMYQQAVAFFRERGSKAHLVSFLTGLSSLEKQRGRQNEASRYAQEALEWGEKLGIIPSASQADLSQKDFRAKDKSE